MTEPPMGSIIELDESSPQAGWCFQRVELGWVRIFRSGQLDRGHVHDWDVLAGHGAHIVSSAPYVGA